MLKLLKDKHLLLKKRFCTWRAFAKCISNVEVLSFIDCKEVSSKVLPRSIWYISRRMGWMACLAL